MSKTSKAVIAAAAAVAFCGLAGSAAAEEGGMSGKWALTGHVGGKDFTLDCKFQQTGPGLSGVCVDGDTHDARVKGGRAHPLTKGAVDGPKVTFTYRSSFGLIGFDANYMGTRQGDHMSGQLSALGNNGTFTGMRTGS